MRRIVSAGEKTAIIEHMELFLKYAFVSLADVIQSEFALGSSLQLAVVFCLHASMKKLIFFCYMWPVLHVHLALVTAHFTHVTPLTPRSISCLIL